MRRDARLLLLAWLFLSTTNAGATQVCTTQQVGGNEFRGISGDTDAHVIAVGKKGTIYRYDGSSWNAMASPGDEDLNDVEVVDANTAFAVGKAGEVLRLAGGVWSSIGGFTTEELFGVWAASATEAYAVGNKGTLFRYDGSSWTDQSVAAGTDNKDLEDAWGDANFFYAIGEQGRLYRYDRMAGSWLPPDTSCSSGDKFEDLWGDSSGDIFLVSKRDVRIFDGSSCPVVATASRDLQGVSGWTQNRNVLAVGKNGAVFEYDGFTWTETQTIDGNELNDDWVSPLGNAYFAGKKKELTTCQCIDCAASVFLITHDSYGISCQDEVMQLQVVDGNTGTPRNDYNDQVTLDTQSGFGSWNLVTGGGSFNDTTPNDGLASYDWPLGETTASFALSYREGPAAIDVDVFQTDDPGVRDTDAEGYLQFSPSGLTVTDAPLSNPPPVTITPFSAPQVAGSDFPVHIAAYGQTPNDPVCGIIEAYTGAKNLKFWFDYSDPVAGTVAASIDAVGIPATEVAASDQLVLFTNGQAAVTGKYKDVGRIQIRAKDDSQAHPDLPNGIRGATAGFVVKPASFVLSNIEDNGGNPNPAPADAAGPAFVAAGELFSVTVTAVDAEGDATPNYGQEIIAESVALAPSLVLPVTGNNPPVGAATGFASFINGQATGTDFNWPEVGIISLLPTIGDNDYLGAGDVAGIASANVGRFHAHHFTSTLNVPTFATSCAAGTFTYIGETFGYSNAPVITFTAKALAGQVTANYTGGFFKVDNASLANRVYTSIPATLDTSALPPGSGDPAVGDLGGGDGTLTFSSGGGIRFTRGAEESPFIADIRVSIDLLDADAAVAVDNPIAFGDPGGIVFDSGGTMRYGRAHVNNAYGSELVDLALPLVNEYYVDATTGFVPSTADACTTGVTLSLGAFTENLAAGESCVLDSGSPGLSGTGCVAVAPPALRFREPPLGGDFNLYLRAPGEGNDGSATATADVPAWLKFDWNVALPGLENPSGTAVFGIYSGSDRRIYIRELY